MAAAPSLDAEVAVIGAGAVGLAVAAELARTHSVVVVERHESYARETSSHNSGVIHSGIYYPTGSRKHRLCLAGNPALYEWCETHSVPVQRVGKLIVALSPHDLPRLDSLEAQAQANAVPGIRRLTASEARELEPAVPSIAALFSTTTGIVDQMAFARSLEGAARTDGALIAYHHEMTSGVRVAGGYELELRDPQGSPTTIRCAAVVNAAGHGAPAVAGGLGYPLDGAEGVPVLRQHVSRGRYYDVVDTEAVRTITHLVYPLPESDASGLGVHVTRDIEGAVHLGPNAEWMGDAEPRDYHNDGSVRGAFLASARRLLPQLRDNAIAPGQVGYRPKLSGPGEPAADFLLWHDRGYVHLGGIESPGLTACMPLAREVAAMLRSSEAGRSL
jgi:L-2-hydroxyglutarate oxidase LhgO